MSMFVGIASSATGILFLEQRSFIPAHVVTSCNERNTLTSSWFSYILVASKNGFCQFAITIFVCVSKNKVLKLYILNRAYITFLVFYCTIFLKFCWY